MQKKLISSKNSVLSLSLLLFNRSSANKRAIRTYPVFLVKIFASICEGKKIY